MPAIGNVENIRAVRSKLRQEAEECKSLHNQLGKLYEQIRAQEATGEPLTAQQISARTAAMTTNEVLAARTAVNSAWTNPDVIPDQDILD